MKRKYEIAVISKGAYARTVRIFNPKKSSSAVILLDGQAPFADKTAKSLFDLCKKKNTALIGIDSPNGSFDFLPFESEIDEFGLSGIGGGADKLCDYLTTTLIPYLTERFAFRSYAVFGSSLSAAAAVYAAFGKAESITAFGIVDAPLFVSPAAFDGLFKSAKPKDAFYYICSTPDGGLNNVPQKPYSISAVSLIAALVNNGVNNIKLDIKTDATNSPVAPVTNFISLLK